MAILSTAIETLNRIDSLIQQLENPAHQHMLTVFRTHWHGEVTGDLDSAMSVLPENSFFEVKGTMLSGKPFSVNSAAEHRAVYQAMLDAKLNPGGAFSDEHFAFADWGLMMEAVYSNVVYGQMLSNVGDFTPDQLYLFHMPMVMICYFSENGNMLGKRDYMSHPINIEKASEEILNQLIKV